MRRNVYMVMHEVNMKKGGITTAALNRTKLFQRKGYEGNLLTFDFKPNYDYIERKMKEIGKLGENSRIINMYSFLKEHKKTFKKNIYIQANENIICNILKYYRKYIEAENIDLYDYEISVIKDSYILLTNNTNYIEINLFENVVQQISITEENKKRVEKYFTNDGFCYLNKTINTLKNKTENINLNYYKHSFSFENEIGLENYFINLIISEDNNKNIESIFIIDGQGSLRRALNLSVKNCKVFFVLHLNHFLKPYNKTSKMDPKLEKVFTHIKDLDGLIVLTEKQKQDIVNVFGHENKIFVIPNYIAKNKLENIKKENKNLIIISRLVKQKRIDRALKVFQMVKQKVPGVNLKIFGDGPEKANLQNIIDKNDLNNSVTLMGHTNRAMKEYKKANINILTSETEAFALTIVEAALCKTPTVTFDINYGPSDLIKSYVNGIIVENEKEMAQSIIYMLKKTNKTKKMGQEGHNIFSKIYSSKNIFKKWDSVFNLN